MASSLTDILVALQNGVANLGSVAKSLSTAFPQVTGTSSSATTGTVTYNSSQPVGFLTMLSTTGATIKVPYFNP
jgi:hypothetical protein